MSLLAYLQRKPVPQDRAALIEVEGGHTTSYGALWSEVDRLASGLRGLGLQPHDHVALALPNSRAWIISFLAVLKAGGIVIPWRQSATPVELKRFLTHCKPVQLIGDSSFINRSLPFDLIEGVEQVVICSKRLIVRSSTRRITRLNDLLQRRFQALPASSSDESQIASINYTYRGYGYPLGAMLSQRNYLHGIETYLQTTSLREGQRCLLALPLSHVYPLIGCLLAPLAIGCTIVIVRTPTATKLREVIAEYHPHVLTGVPTLYATLARQDIASSLDLGGVEQAYCGGSLMPVSLYEEIHRRWGVSIRQGYGLTECLPVTCNPSSGNRPETLGKVGMGVHVKVCGEDGAEKLPGEVGEITVAGPTVMTGYYNMPRETSEVLRSGWFFTGDYGWFDSGGYLHFRGVKKRIAKVAGNMVDLAEVEREVLTFPGVIEVRSYAIPDRTLGEIVGCDVTCRESKMDTKEIRRYLRTRLASYKVPHLRVSRI